MISLLITVLLTYPCLQYGVVLPRVLGVVALQQTAAHGGARTRKLRHVEVGEAQLGGSKRAGPGHSRVTKGAALATSFYKKN